MALNHARAERRARIIRLVRPFQEFGRTEASSGIVIISAVLLALIAANTPLSGLYEDFIHHHIAIDVGLFHLESGLKEWVNDGLMVIFFFVVGMEIKREVVVGELSGGRKVWAPIAAAAGGMIVPVIIFLALVDGETAREGWAIPMATDIAIAVGVVTLVGSRVPTGLKVLLLALAIVDDIGAIAVIAVFYTDNIDLAALALAAGLLGLVLLMNFNGIKLVPLYIVVGLAGWMAAHESGVHPTILGVALGIMTPLQPWYRRGALPDLAEALLSRIRASESAPSEEPAHHDRVGALLTLSDLSEQAISPLDRIETPPAAVVGVRHRPALRLRERRCRSARRGVPGSCLIVPRARRRPRAAHRQAHRRHDRHLDRRALRGRVAVRRHLARRLRDGIGRRYRLHGGAVRDRAVVR